MTEIATRLSGTYINVDGAAGNQCWDSAARVAQLLGLPVVSTWGEGRWPGWAGNMFDAFPQTPAIAAAYTRVGPDLPGQPGDTAIWGATPGYYPSTHVASVVRDAGGLLLCISQNSSAARPDLPGYSTDSTGPTILQHLTKRGLLGYLRPRVSTINPQGTTEEGDDVFTPEAQEWLKENLFTKADGAYQNDRMLNKSDGAYMNNKRDAQFAAIMAGQDKTLTKEDGGYIVRLVESTRPGAEDPEVAADNILKILPGEIAAQVVALLGQKLGAK
jgi:hypothetical protein